jgi:hypothetical protein
MAKWRFPVYVITVNSKKPIANSGDLGPQTQLKFDKTRARGILFINN